MIGCSQKILNIFGEKKSIRYSFNSTIEQIYAGEIITNWINKDGQKTDVNFSLPGFLKPFRQNNIVYSTGGTIKPSRKDDKKNHEGWLFDWNNLCFKTPGV